MQGSTVLIAVAMSVVSFALVAGYAGLAWLRRGRDPSFIDDSSILTAAPPPALTAATAVIVDGGPTRLAFMAALLDLASRDEIAFKEEIWGGYPMGVGIAIRGGESNDPRVLLNRRKPVGEGEAWLLNQLRTNAASAGRVPLISVGQPSAAYTQVWGQWWAGIMQVLGSASGAYDGPEDVAARQRGLLSGPTPEPGSLAQSYTDGTGHPLSENARLVLDAAGPEMQAWAHPADVARDPDAFARQLEARSGKPLTAEQRESLKKLAALYAPALEAVPLPTYIPAERARQLRAPLLFGPLVENYAKRHGWLAGLPVLQRLRWRLIGAGEVGFAMLLAAFIAYAPELVGGVAAGIAAGGVVTFLIAAAMPARTPAGAEIKAQIAAYRRTLRMTFGQVGSMDEVVDARSLTWLETPDQALVWGVALGLQAEIEALLARTAGLLVAGHAPAATYVPAWYGWAPAGAPTAVGAPGAGQRGAGLSPGAPEPATPAGATTTSAGTAPASVAQAHVMFAAIAAIGGGGGRAGLPARFAGWPPPGR